MYLSGRPDISKTTNLEGAELSFFSALKDHRFSERVTQEELAEAIGVTRQTIIELELGRVYPSFVVAYKLAKYFNCKIEDLFYFAKEWRFSGVPRYIVRRRKDES